MNRKGMFVSILCLVMTQFSQAQNDADALRYSMINWGSTARSLGMGNAFGALGADPSVMATNPAGLGFYRHSEFSLTSNFNIRATSSEFLGNRIKDDNFKFNFGNLGFVWAFPKDDKYKDWKGWTFGIGYNRLNDFGSRSYAEGVNKNNSLLDSYLEQIVNDQTSPESFPDQYPFDINLAWQTFLLDTVSDTSNNLYIYSAIPESGARQRRTVETSGGMGEWDFSFGTNYKDKIYLGTTLGLVSLNYKEDVSWEETDVNNTIASIDSNHNFRSYNYTQNLQVNGSGFNFKFGIIYKPSDWVRFGAAIHTPTFLRLTDDYQSSFTALYDGGSNPSQFSPDFIPFDYNINTPFRFIGSLGFIIGKFGIVSADYEYVNYSLAEINPRDKSFQSDFIDANYAIGTKYGPSHNFRIGGELRYDNLRFRLGTSIYGTPFKSGFTDKDTDQSRKSINGGMGIRHNNIYFDVGYSYTKSGAFSGVYSVDNAITGANQTTFDHRLMFTFGFNY